jgi:hypothetical protein
MGHDDEEAVLRHLRARLRAVEGLADRWARAADRMEAPEGFRCPRDAGIAAVEIRRALGTRRRR